MFLFFLYFSSVVTTLTSGVNLKTFSRNYNESAVIEIEVRTFDYYIIFNEVPLNSTLIEYRSQNELELRFYKKYNINDIDLYLHIEFPFAKQVIIIPYGGRISFSYGSLQDMCQDGLIMTNQNSCTYTLSSNYTDLYKIGISEDKCIMLTNPSNQQTFLLDVSGFGGKILLYQNGEAVQEWTGTCQKYTIADASHSPVLIRLLSGSSTSIQRIRIAMASYTCIPYKKITAFWYHKVVCPEEEECSLYRALHMTTAFITFIVICILSLIFSVTYYILIKICCPRFSHYKPHEDVSSISTHEKGENRTVPGYYVMAPILG